MLFWVPSYPRSGRTFFRLICNKVFQTKTYKGKGSIDGPLFLANDIKFNKEQWRQTRLRMLNCNHTIFVQMHGGPDAGRIKVAGGRVSSGKTIYIVRDGRAVMSSLWKFTQDFEGGGKSLVDVILGKTQHGQWTKHLEKWNPLDRKDLLLVRYEDMLNSPELIIRKVADFTGLKTVLKWENQFENWSKAEPKYYRKGIVDSWKEDWSKEVDDVFWSKCGGWMRKLGYGR